MMTYFGEVYTAPTALPITVAAADQALAAAVTEEIERTILWRAIVRQTRRITVDGPLPPHLEIEPTKAIVITRWTPTDDAAVISATDYISISRDPSGTIVIPAAGKHWPEPQRAIGSFSLVYSCGWEVTATDNAVPLLIQLMVSRAVSFRAGAGLGNIGIGSLKLDVEPSYSTDKLPSAIASIGRAYAYRPGLIAARP